MEIKHKLPLVTMLLLISFASVNAVMFTPALPDIANYFAISHDKAQLTISWYLIGYASGQLIYGPLANRFGRKPTIYGGVILQIISSLICAASGFIHWYPLLVIGRLLLAFGSGVGLKMTFTLVNECYPPKAAAKMISFLILAFAITPGLSAALGGILNQSFGWISCFYAGAAYGLVLLAFAYRLPETLAQLDFDALKWPHLIESYGVQFKNQRLVAGALMMGTSTCFVYTFAAIAPFVAINMLGMASAEYGIANILPAVGLAVGTLTSARLTERFDFNAMIIGGLAIAAIGVFLMFTATWLHGDAIHSIFIPMMIIYLGLSAILANASTIAMSDVEDKSHGAAVMSFINMGTATVVVLAIGWLHVTTILMPILFLAYCAAMAVFYWMAK
ncbi:MAG TPA: MFS transporter [Gammaproteobacteria bacterium]|nr:MFS transporter [Gammaproteobacteria bacterium]